MKRLHQYLTDSTRLRRLVLTSLAFLVVALACEAQGQLAPYAFPPRENPYARNPIRITNGGNIIMDLGNYDVVFGPYLPLGNELREQIPGLNNGDQLTGISELNDAYRTGVLTSPQIIFKGGSGLRWDGRNYFYHPEYPYDIVARYHYRNRVVGRGEEQYPPLSQDSRKAQSKRVVLEEEGTEMRLPFGQITPAPLPGTENLPEICRRYPYAIQCRPTWVAQPEAARMPCTFIPPDDMLEPSEPQPSRAPPSAPSILIPERPPIILLCPQEGTDDCDYELLSERGNYSYTLSPGQKQVVRADRDWRIRFDSSGMGVKTYRLRSGKTYRFSKDQSNVWQFRWLRKPAATSKTEVPSIAPQ